MARLYVNVNRQDGAEARVAGSRGEAGAHGREGRAKRASKSPHSARAKPLRTNQGDGAGQARNIGAAAVRALPDDGTIPAELRSLAVTLRHANMWVVASAGGIVVLGLAMLAIPSSAIGPNARLSGWVLLAAGGLELLGALTRRRPPVKRIELLMGMVTIAAAALILVRPQAYPLLFVAIICLLLRGVGAVAAGFMAPRAVRAWVIGRGLFDLGLGAILIAGAPLAAIISIISGNRWPDRAGAVLTNFVALSMLVTGLALLGLALTAGRGRAANIEGEE